MVVYSFYESDNRVRRYAETLARQGNNVDIVSLRQKGQSANNTLNGVAIHRIQERIVNESSKFDYFFRIVSFFIRSFLFATIKYFRKRYQIVHIHSVPDFEVFAAIIPKIMGAKIILDIHDIVPEFYASKFETGPNSLIFRILVFIERISCCISDHVIISNHIWYERIIKRSVKKEKCSVILNYPDPYIFKRNREKCKSNNFTIIYPGTIAWHQGLDIAVKAMALLKENESNIKLNIFGKGPDESSLRKMVNELKVADCVCIHGMLPMEEIVEKIIDADLGLVPKRNDSFGGEAFSTKILEFMLMEVPVLISETKIDRYYFNDDVATFFRCDDEQHLAEKISFLRANKAVLKRQTESAKEYIAENNWDVKKKEYEDLISGLLRN